MKHPKSAEEQRLAKAFAGDRSRFVQEGLRPVVAALRGGDLAQAQRIVVEATRPLYSAVHGDIQSLMRFQLDAAQQSYVAAASRYATIRAAALACIAGGVAIAMLFGTLLIRAVCAFAHASDRRIERRREGGPDPAHRRARWG